MSDAFCSLPYADKKDIIGRLTILVKELKKTDDSVMRLSYFGDLETLRNEVERIKTTVEFKRLPLKGLLSDILDLLCDPVLFHDLSVDQIGEYRIERLGMPVLIIENMNLSQAYKYKSVIDIRDILNEAYKRKNYLDLRDRWAWSDLTIVGPLGIAFGLAVAVLASAPRKEDAATSAATGFTLLKSLRL